jgi:uncharacterized Ntn-hydrolase superfamily protein
VAEHAGTYSIVAADPASGEIGVGVQSKYFAVGAVVPWARAGVGAVATQAAVVAGYGPRILELLEAGVAPAAAIEQALADDDGRATRQLGVVDARGVSASWTGSECNEWAGDVQGEGYAAQGNILAGEAVVTEMARAYEQAEGSLAERLIAAIEAAEAAGGDRRGQQSAALVVERVGAGESSRRGIDRIVDLRVDDHERPVAELRRLLELHARSQLADDAYVLYERGDPAAAAQALRAGRERFPDDAMLLYNLACFESLAGAREAALGNLERALELDASFTELARDDVDFEPLRGEEHFRRLVGS